MTIEILLLLVILAVALVFFSFEWVTPDVTGLGLLMALIVLHLIPVENAFAGFGSDTVMMLLGLLILTAALINTGVVEIISQALFRFTRKRPKQLTMAITISAGILSAFISNTAATAIYLPVILGITQRAKLNVSKLLLPLAFAAILASSVTLVSTSTNIVVSGLLAQAGLAPIGMFELTPVGLPILVLGLIYLLTIGQRLIVERHHPETLTENFGLRPYLAELRLTPESGLVGHTLSQAGLGRDLDLTVLAVLRDGKRYLAPSADIVLHTGDSLLVEGARPAILKIKDITGIDIQMDGEFSDTKLETKDLHLAEVVLLPHSIFIGRTPRGLGVREKYKLQVLAVSRHAGTIYEQISKTRLRMGDVLLVQGSREHIAALKAENAFDVLGVVEQKAYNRRRAPLAIGIFSGMLALATLKILPLPVAMLLGALLVFLTRCITPEEAYRRLEWKILILIGCMLALGAAMEYTGTAKYLAEQLVKAVGGWEPIWLLTAFFGLTVLLTQPMSNQAAAAVVLPVAIQTAIQLGLNPRTFAMMIAVAASTSFLTPLEPACLIVYGPGHYRFTDFLKVGALLTLLIYLIAIYLVPWVWPL
jgi:di/tricarboxylate transporter